MTQSLSGFFTGGGKGITWPDQPGAIDPQTGQPGRTQVSGTITAIHPQEEIMSIATPSKPSEPTGKFQVRIELATDERDPQAEYDDGARTLYVKSWMRSAIGDALRKVNEKEPKIGGKLTVVFTHTEPPERPGLSPSKKFTATYEAPAVTGQFFNGQPQYAPGQTAQAYPGAPGYQAPVGPPPQVAPQPGFQGAYPPPGGYPANLQPQQAVPQQAAQAAPVQQVEPQRPAAISEQAWAAMDASTKAAVAATMSDAPPF